MKETRTKKNKSVLPRECVDLKKKKEGKVRGMPVSEKLKDNNIHCEYQKREKKLN